MGIIKHRKIFIAIALVLSLMSIFVMVTRGFDYGIEFTGGSLLEVSYTEGTQPDIDHIHVVLDGTPFESSLVQPLGSLGYVIKTDALDDSGGKLLEETLALAGGDMTVERFNSIGPSVGKQLQTKSLYALIGVSFATLLFVAFAFRKISGPVSSWKYGVVAVGLLIHDILVTVGVLSFLGIEVDTLYVVGLLSILGLSINNTIVVFDRIRENLLSYKEAEKNHFFSLVGSAITQTLHRSIFISLAVVIVLTSLLVVGPESTKTLSLTLLIGIVVGTYSSIFLASPLITLFIKKED